MPSLRRAFSSPSVRVSPYPALPSSRSHRAHPHGHRRSSGSDLSDRKVLADIDWWRVADGQGERGGEEEDEEEEAEERGVGEENPVPADAADSERMAIASRNDAIPALSITDRDEGAAGVEPERPSTPVAPQSPLSEGDDQNIFGFSFQPHVSGRSPSESSFALRSRTPMRRNRNASESSTSSVSSTPDSDILRTPIERPSFAGMGFADLGPESPLFHKGFASLGAFPFVPKYGFPGKQLEGVDLNDDRILPDPLTCHDDLFA